MAASIEWSSASIRRLDNGDAAVSIPLSARWVGRDARSWNALAETLEAVLPNMVADELTVEVDPVTAFLHISSPDLYECDASDLRAAVEAAVQSADDVVRGEHATDDTIGRDWVERLRQ